MHLNCPNAQISLITLRPLLPCSRLEQQLEEGDEDIQGAQEALEEMMEEEEEEQEARAFRVHSMFQLTLSPHG